MSAPRTAFRALLAGIVAATFVTALAGCVGSDPAAPGAAGAAANRALPSAAATASVSPAPGPTITPAPPTTSPTESAPLDPLAELLVAAGRSLSAGTEGLASLEARAALDQATAVLGDDVQLVPVDPARIAADIAAVYPAVHSVRQGVVETPIRVVYDETPNADAGLRDALFVAITEQQAETAATADTPRQVLDLVSKLQAVQDSEAAFAAQQQAAAGDQRPDGGGPADSNDDPAGGGGGGGQETYCADPAHPTFCLPIVPIAPAG